MPTNLHDNSLLYGFTQSCVDEDSAYGQITLSNNEISKKQDCSIFIPAPPKMDTFENTFILGEPC